jgi:cysteine synthase A
VSKAQQALVEREPDTQALTAQDRLAVNHPIQGGGYAMSSLSQLEGVRPDGFLAVSAQEATDCARRLAREEGIFAGYSSGANLAAALSLLRGPLPGATVVAIACDSGLKYLSTTLWDR